MESNNERAARQAPQWQHDLEHIGSILARVWPALVARLEITADEPELERQPELVGAPR